MEVIMAFLDGLSKVVKVAGDLTKRAGKAIEDGGEFLAQPENQEKIRKTVNDAKDSVVNVFNDVTGKSKTDKSSAGDDEDIVVDIKDVTPTDDDVNVEVLQPRKDDDKSEF
jgi:hypothetical protein